MTNRVRALAGIIVMMIREEPDGYWLELEETIASHYEEVFACFTTEGGLTRWYPVAAKVDLQPGGSIVLCWDENCTRTLTVNILEYDAGGSITWSWPIDRTETEGRLIWTVTPAVEDGAKVKLRLGPFTSDRESLLALAAEAASWRWQLCNLRTALEVKHDMRKVRPL
ncbi:MAG: SRPBCC domain-containing protein [Phycisphaerales bacterium]|nr:MAG: SRPBCC domain-containing protein [Phycisphaerales bacterium]